MGKVILRILVSDPSEFKFVVMNGIESRGLVDRVIVVEHDYSHSGVRINFSFKSREDELRRITGNENIEVHSVSIKHKVIMNAESSEDMHANERLIRSSFLGICGISDDDFIVAVDGDEIIYRRTYKKLKLIKSLTPVRFQVFSLKLHQFFYKMNYLWTDTLFRSPVALSGKIALSNPNMLRDSGHLLPLWAGCHFSWQLDIQQMIHKLANYAHSPEYRHLAKPEILEDAVQNKNYPFDPQRAFTIKVLNSEELDRYAPESLRMTSYLFPENYLGE